MPRPTSPGRWRCWSRVAALGVRRVVYASSAAIYGVPERVPIREDAPTQPLSPYGLSKLTGEQYVLLYGDLFGLDTCALRFFNVYGPGPATG